VGLGEKKVHNNKERRERSEPRYKVGIRGKRGELLSYQNLGGGTVNLSEKYE